MSLTRWAWSEGELHIPYVDLIMKSSFAKQGFSLLVQAIDCVPRPDASPTGICTACSIWIHSRTSRWRGCRCRERLHELGYPVLAQLKLQPADFAGDSASAAASRLAAWASSSGLNAESAPLVVKPARSSSALGLELVKGLKDAEEVARILLDQVIALSPCKLTGSSLSDCFATLAAFLRVEGDGEVKSRACKMLWAI